MRPQPTEPDESVTTVEHSTGANDPFRPLLLPRGLRLQVVRHLERWLPYEGCGLLATVGGPEHDRAVHFFPGTNIDRSPTRYTMDPREVLDAMKRMRARGWSLGAIVHSHPSSRPSVSRTDAREAYYPDSRLLIVSFLGGDPDFGCWARSRDPETPGFFPSPLIFWRR